MGANFEVAEYASTGSGSPAVRGVLYYENTWGAKPLNEYTLEESLRLTLRALDTAAEADTATGGVDRHGRIFPVIKIINAKGITTIEDDALRSLFQRGPSQRGASLFRRVCPWGRKRKETERRIVEAGRPCSSPSFLLSLDRYSLSSASV